MISSAKRRELPEGDFALPSQRKYPLDTAARTRNAAARLEQMKKAGKIGDGDYGSAKGRIAKAAKKFGITSEYNAPKKPKRLRVTADLAPGGMMHVRHLSDVHLDGVTIALGDDAAKRVWIQLAEVGSFKGHPAGPFSLDNKVFSEIVTNFKRDKLPIPIDAEHASEADPTSGNIPSQGAPAFGWIHELDNRGDQGLWGLVEWLEPARSYIKEGRYRYLSPAIRFGARDRVTGESIGARLSSAAITNSPFLRSMSPLVAAKDTAEILQIVAQMIQAAMDDHVEEYHSEPSEDDAYAAALGDGKILDDEDDNTATLRDAALVSLKATLAKTRRR